jgi:hypothetical protein
MWRVRRLRGGDRRDFRAVKSWSSWKSRHTQPRSHYLVQHWLQHGREASLPTQPGLGLLVRQVKFDRGHRFLRAQVVAFLANTSNLNRNGRWPFSFRPIYTTLRTQLRSSFRDDRDPGGSTRCAV